MRAVVLTHHAPTGYGCLLPDEAERPVSRALNFTALEGLMAIFNAFQNRLVLTAFEFFSEKALAHVVARGLQRPFDTIVSSVDSWPP